MANTAQISAPALVVKNKALLTIAIMLGTIMQVLDTTIANVALPHMASSLGAAQNEITWVLTSYIVAAAIATPLTGWMSDRLGQRRLFVMAVIGFTIASALCGIATSLPEMVLFRVLQGICGAMIAPLAQTVILNINPKEKLGQAMAIYGMGIMVAPIVGPTLGGWLTESFDWRWVFLVNVPVGIACVAMLLLYMPTTEIRHRRFDFFGFGTFALAIGALQLMLDRGAENSWFSSPETWIELGLVISGLWVFIVHSLTTENPFIDLRIFKDFNFVLASLFMIAVGITLFSGLALLPPLLQNLMGYSVIFTGMLMAPRGLATMLSMMIVGRLSGKVDPRILMLFGAVLMTYSLWEMTAFNLQMDYWPIVWTGALQGFGMGFVFVPLSSMAFTTIATHLRADATSMFSLVRNLGQGIGISVVSAVLANMMQVNHAELAERLTPTSQAVAQQMPGLLTGNPQILAIINGLVQQQAAILAYLDDFWLMAILSAACVPLIFLLRGPKKAASAKPKTEEEKALERAHAMSE
ncbi:DHA2 family efflux MFS transporter permease subunit [Paradevosia shaoguanensis]|uniref:DHA2 family efflux MFS transporter permease subunit n=1 Tax=Paradevosia shaoguanensis TaxID=1335043 RepID=A0AA41QIS3_9HYPH|nr:DHA2 family efflux MFS transporter permease subunit [Paradevosia shaoguanensis]MCF1740891.1 DHA2 family efflux MFS transporter permease subunit [Paradevosia shaoguanensis]MCI0125375.1 DHA2 family efflux MFS transporter permease subunit [Paradevosia shaoguanensis]QMV03671.1 DHA2 family efflux MFS transporter permease subunit [Devosia sp. D6-9]